MDLQELVNQIPIIQKQQKSVPSVDSLIEAVIKRESSGNPRAVSPVGARGLMQIMPVVLQEYNQYNKARHSPDDLFNPAINRQIGTWYLNERIPQMLRYFNIPDTTPNRLRAYNSGVGALKKGRYPTETRNYVKNIMGDL